MSRIIYMVASIAIYFIFFATFLYLIGFVGNLPFLPLTVDRGPEMATLPALIVDLVLIAVFGVQHSVMARPSFKRTWVKIVPEPLERSVFVLFASVMLIALFAFWCPIPAVIWDVQAPIGRDILMGLSGLGWLIVLLSTFLINHFELFGLTQPLFHMLRRQPSPAKFRVPFLYKMVRHPLYSGFLIAFWATPTMTAGHMLFSIGMSIYILIAIRYEERDLVSVFGEDYETYRADVGMLTPKLGRAGK
jgi:protein-S-isoprenylcysteine O-methyltransferase Ste14